MFPSDMPTDDDPRSPGQERECPDYAVPARPVKMQMHENIK